MEAHWREIVRQAHRADILIVTHYHYDHHNPWEGLEIYEGKRVFVKDPEEEHKSESEGRGPLSSSSKLRE